MNKVSFLALSIFLLGFSGMAHADDGIECSAAIQQQVGAITYLTAPTLTVTSNTGMQENISFATQDESYSEPQFANHICSMCGWGSTATDYYLVDSLLAGSPPAIYAFLDGSGNLTRIGNANSDENREILVVDSLSCQ